MSYNDNFNWHDYYKLADSYSEEIDAGTNLKEYLNCLMS
jgi:hypothetical protein